MCYGSIPAADKNALRRVINLDVCRKLPALWNSPISHHRRCSDWPTTFTSLLIVYILNCGTLFYVFQPLKLCNNCYKIYLYTRFEKGSFFMHMISVCVLFPPFKMIIFQVTFQENALELCYVSMFGKLYRNDSRESLIQDHTQTVLPTNITTKQHHKY